MKTGDKVYSTCGEIFNYESPDFDIGDVYYEGTVQEITPSRLVGKWTVSNILGTMDENLYGIVGECSEDALELSDEDQESLLKYIKDFMDKNATISCFHVTDVVEKVME